MDNSGRDVGARPLGRLLAVVGLLALTVLGLTAGPAGAHGPEAARDGAAPRVVRVGTEGTYPPFTYVDPRTGSLTGYDVEVMKAVAKRAGWRPRFVQGQFDALFPALDAGRLDVLANQITINPERRARYLFSRPYTYSHGVIVTRADEDDITSLADLEGRTAGQSETSNWAQVARDAGAKVESIDSFAQAATLLEQGRIDVIVNDNIAVLDYLASTGSKRIKISGDAGEEVSEQALVFRRSEKALRDQADQALAALGRDGTLRAISEKYFKADVSVRETSDDVAVKGSDSRSRWQVVQDTAWPMLRGALTGTLPLAAISFVCGLALGLLAALGRLSGRRWLDLPSRVYISIIRGTPLLVQLFIVFFGLPQLGIDLPGYVAAALALSLNVGGYAAEIIRASILSVPRGQLEAAYSIGMDYRQGMRRIVLPQAARIAVPPLSNTLLSLVKDTSLVSIVLVTDLFRETRIAADLSTEYLPLYCLAALYYWIICYLLSLGQGALEKRLARFAP